MPQATAAWDRKPKRRAQTTAPAAGAMANSATARNARSAPSPSAAQGANTATSNPMHSWRRFFETPTASAAVPRKAPTKPVPTNSADSMPRPDPSSDPAPTEANR